MIVTIEPEDIAELQRVAWEHFAVRPTHSAARGLIQKNLSLQAELLYGGLGDTMARDAVVDAMTEHLLGPRRRWPINMDSERKSKRFYHDFFTKALDAGWEVNPDVVEHNYVGPKGVKKKARTT